MSKLQDIDRKLELNYQAVAANRRGLRFNAAGIGASASWCVVLLANRIGTVQKAGWLLLALGITWCFAMCWARREWRIADALTKRADAIDV